MFLFFIFGYVIILDDRIIYVAYKTGSGYASRVLDPDLGYVYTYVLDGQFIYADKVRVIITHLPGGPVCKSNVYT